MHLTFIRNWVFTFKMHEEVISIAAFSKGFNHVKAGKKNFFREIFSIEFWTLCYVYSSMKSTLYIIK